MSEADIFVLSSDYEGMPNALMEALAVGVPSVSTDCPCGGPKMLISNGENGLLVPVNDLNKMVEMLDYLFVHKVEKDEMGKLAKERSYAFHPEKIITEWKLYINSIIDKK